MDFIVEKASDRKKDCEYCKAGTLHQHIVEVDTNMTEYILGLGEFKEKKTLSDKIMYTSEIPLALKKEPYKGGGSMAGASFEVLETKDVKWFIKTIKAETKVGMKWYKLGFHKFIDELAGEELI